MAKAATTQKPKAISRKLTAAAFLIETAARYAGAWLIYSNQSNYVATALALYLAITATGLVIRQYLIAAATN